MIKNKNILYKVLFSIILGFIFFRVEGKTIYNFPTGQQYEYNFPVGQQDRYAYPNRQEPYYNNNDYEVWIRSIINQQDFVFVNLLVKPKRNFRHKSCYKIKKSDRIDFLSPYTLRIIENGNENTENFLPYTGMDNFKLAHYEGKPFDFFGQEYSINLDKNKPDELTLVFRGHLKSTTSNISIIQGDNDKYFEFYGIPVQFPKHDEWEILNKEEDFIQAMQESNNIICGIYKIDGLRFACIPNNNQFYLICLDNSKDYKWHGAFVFNFFWVNIFLS